MVYIGLGLFAATLSFILYRYGLSNKFYSQEQWDWMTWLRRLRIINGDASNSDTPNVIADHKISIKQQNSESENDVNLPDIPSIASDFSELKANNGRSVPIFTIDDDRNENPAMKYEPQTGSNTENTIAISSKKLESVSKQPQQKPSSTMAPPPRPTRIPNQEPQLSSKSLMPPPSQLSTNNSALRPLPKLSKTLQPPPSAASTLRMPPSRPIVPSTYSLQPSTSTLSPSKRPSKKVLLDPGHSPLDWAHLVKNPPTPTFLRGALVPANLIRVSPSLLKYHNGRKGKDAWGVWQGRVYNLTPYMRFHPGGIDELMKAAGREKDGERLFLEVHPWVSWESMLGECMVGILVGENEVGPGGGNGEDHLEEMD